MLSLRRPPDASQTRLFNLKLRNTGASDSRCDGREHDSCPELVIYLLPYASRFTNATANESLHANVTVQLRHRNDKTTAGTTLYTVSMDRNICNL